MNTKVKEDYKESSKQRLFHKKDYFLLQGMPINKHMQFRDFIKNSHFELNDFGITDHGYRLTINCITNKSLLYSLAGAGRTWIYKGGGHIMLKEHPNADNESTIGYIFIKIQDKEN